MKAPCPVAPLGTIRTELPQPTNVTTTRREDVPSGDEIRIIGNDRSAPPAGGHPRSSRAGDGCGVPLPVPGF